MAHIFNPSNMARLDDPRRKSILPPHRVLTEMGLQSGQNVLDIGAGTGYFTIPAAEIVGEKGKVLASDVSQEMLNELKLRIPKSVNNIETLLTGFNAPEVTDITFDVIIMAFVFHEIEDRLTYLKKIIPYIKPKGKLIIFEWEKVEMEMGPPIHDRMSFEEVSSYFSEIKTLNLENKKINGAHYATVINF